MRFWLLPFCVSWELCPYKLLLLLLCFVLMLFVGLIQVFRAVPTLTVLVELVKILQPAMLLLTSVLHSPLRRVDLLSVRS